MDTEIDYPKLVTLLETRQEDVIFLSRNGTPVVEMKRAEPLPFRKPGLGKDVIHLPENFWDLDQKLDKEIEEMFDEALAKLDDV